jgi:uncharacterized membrane protein YcaP (DUF421 family)
MGKRQIGELQPTELVITLLLSEIIAIPIQETNVPLFNTLIAVFLLVGFEIFASIFNMKSIKFRNLIQGHPLIVIDDGKIDQKLIKQLRFTIDDLLEALRQKDVFDISQVQYAIVETNGQMSVLLKPEYEPVTREDLKINPQQTKLQCLVVADGQMILQDFDICKTNEKKLYGLLKKNKVKLNDIMLMTIDKNGNKNIIRKENK